MKLISIIAAALVSSALAAPGALTASEQNAILGNITYVVTNVTALDKVVLEAKGGRAYTTAQLLSILGYTNSLSTDVQDLTSAVNASNHFTNTESTKVASALKPLNSDTLQLLGDFNSHFKSFNASGVQSSVLSSLVSQREASRELGNSLVLKFATAQKANAKKNNAALAAEYNKVIATYNQTSS